MSDETSPSPSTTSVPHQDRPVAEMKAPVTEDAASPAKPQEQPADRSQDAESRPQAKLPPEALMLRTAPQGAIRFRRGVIVAIAGLGSAALMWAAWTALQPRIFAKVAQADQLSKPNANRRDAIAGLPRTYAEVPRLGPPLPGDLGRPMLRAQQRADASQADASRARADAAQAEKRERLALLKAARESGLLAPVSTSDRQLTMPLPELPAQALTPTLAMAPPSDPPDRKLAFSERPDTGADVNMSSLQPPASPYLLATGSVIAGSLITGLNSDLPGLVMAQVTQNVFDSVTGKILLVPQGARLVGKYDSVVAFGQQRALVIWQRLMLPDGSSLRLDNFPATDAGGYAGLADKVDFHGWTLLKGVAISTLLGVGSEISINGDGDLVDAIRQSTQQSVSRAGDQLTARNLDIQPTITIRPGAPVRMLVVRDLVLAPWRGSSGDRP